MSPGTAVDKEAGIRSIADCINRAHKQTKFVKVVLENSAGSRNAIGNTFEDLRGIIDYVEGIHFQGLLMRSIESGCMYRYMSCICGRYILQGKTYKATTLERKIPTGQCGRCLTK
jgi:hypothetical protein